jgi:hypothetical protein
MTTHQYAAPAAGKGGTDVAAWALVALIVAVVCAFAGWAVASGQVLSQDDLARNAALAAQDGLVRGEAEGYRQGATQGRRESALRTRTRIDAERREAAREGYAAGYQQGRALAGDPNAFLASTAGAGAYPPAGYEDILAAGLFGPDAPGYSDSAYDAYGYGIGVTTPYRGATTPLATSLGDY